jgi:hypothetical protein
MRFSQGFACLVVLSVAASAAELRIKVVDPQSGAVFGAQVELLPRDSGIPAAVETTSAEGLAVFRNVPSGPLSMRVLAAGFGAQTTDAPTSQDLFTVRLQLAPAAETVVVTATRSPVSGETSGASVATLTAAQLEVTRPIAANDALRFLPGAVVSTSGQRGGVSSLFVRGGDSDYNKVIVDGVTINVPGRTFDFGNLPVTQADRLEFMRGAQSTLYGSDAVTSVVQIWTRTGSTRVLNCDLERTEETSKPRMAMLPYLDPAAPSTTTCSAINSTQAAKALMTLTLIR